jgi:pyruvate dehydrogenase E2 component (dihydrolipoamide acetyltransferase)
MRALRAITLAAALVVVLPAAAAVAQVSVDPSVTPEINTGGWVHGMAILFGVLGLLVILLLVAGYVRFAPRFSTDESTLRVVRADRVRPGEELPRRTVDIKAAAPLVVAPPPLPQPAGVAAAPAPAAAPAAAAPAPAAAPAQAGPGAEAPSTEAPQAAPASEEAPAEADAATQARETPAAETSAPAPAPAAPAERHEVSLDQEVFDQTLKELLEKGTDKRVAEGQARRAAMIAARKKAAGEA